MLKQNKDAVLSTLRNDKNTKIRPVLLPSPPTLEF